MKNKPKIRTKKPTPPKSKRKKMAAAPSNGMNMLAMMGGQGATKRNRP